MQSEPLHVDLKGPPHSSGLGVAFHLRGQTRVVCGTYDNTETISIRSGGQEITLFVTPGQLRALADAISRAVDCLDAAPGADERAARGFGAFEDIARASYKGSGDVP